MKYEKIRRNLVFHLMEFSTRFLWRKNWANTSCADSLFELEPTAEGVAHFKDNLARSQTHNFYQKFKNNGKSISDYVKSFYLIFDPIRKLHILHKSVLLLPFEPNPRDFYQGHNHYRKNCEWYPDLASYISTISSFFSMVWWILGEHSNTFRKCWKVQLRRNPQSWKIIRLIDNFLFRNYLNKEKWRHWSYA